MPTYPKLTQDRGWLETVSEANIDETQPEYPYNHIIATDSGHSFEMDDTPGRERIRLQHRSGTFTEVHSDGTEVHKIIGDGYEIVTKDKNVLISGRCSITVNGDATFIIKGDKNEKIEGNYNQEIVGNFTQVVRGNLNTISEKDINMYASATPTGRVSISAGGDVFVNSDLFVDGVVAADQVTAEGRIDAGTGVSAGLLGFVSLTGGLSIGVPAAAPQTIICSGGIYSASITAPLASFGTSSSLFHSDLINTITFNAHKHIAPKGTTSLPLPQQKFV
jgi:hypothetical protein